MKLSLFTLLWLGVNLYAFFLYRYDKRQALRGHTHDRVPERTLLLAAALFGACGAWLAMVRYHHKTRKWKFRLFVPLCAAGQLLFMFLRWAF